jgi:hypothetical protein
MPFLAQNNNDNGWLALDGQKHHSRHGCTINTMM